MNRPLYTIDVTDQGGFMEGILEPDDIGPAPSIDLDEAQSVTVKEKWQGAVADGSGFVAVPVALLRLQTKYCLTPTEMLVLINLLAHWWDPARGVYPRSTTIAKRMGIAKRTVQRATQKMEKFGLIERHNLEDGRRIFTFDCLAKRLANDLPAAYIFQRSETLERH